MSGKAIDERLRSLEEKRAQIERRLKQLTVQKITADRKLDARRKIIVGALALGAAEVSSHHREWLLAVLRNAPRRPFDVPIIDGLIEALEGAGPENQ